MRHLFVWLHRWVGLALALFLIVEGGTGAVLAFRVDLSNLFDPTLVTRKPSADAMALDLAVLAEKAEALAPRAQVAYFVRSADDQAVLRMEPRKDPSSGELYSIDSEILVLDPWTGHELGRSPFSRYTSGFLPNVMPFIYDLHTTLAGILFGFGDIGVWILAFVALLWTIDCFVGFYLTLPVNTKRFWERWKTAWQIKRGSGFFRLNFDLHRAGGLWLWPMLFIFAWSSVTLVDKLGAYDAVMGKLFDYPMMEMLSSLFLPRTDDGPAKLSWREAQSIGERLMADQAHKQGFNIEKPLALNHMIDSRLYNYIVKTDRTFPADRTDTVFFDADTGEFVSVLPTMSGHTGITITNWLRALHMIQDPVDYLFYRIFVVFVGLGVVMLSVTGVYIWWRKRQASVIRAEKRNSVKQTASTSIS
jgi:uncharacterized iron-regulated membrane protein